MSRMSPEEQDRQRQALERDPETGGILMAHVVGDPQMLMAVLTEFEDRAKARIGFDITCLGDGTRVEVSTVDLVWAAPGGAFETAIFVDGHGPQYVERYTSRNAAALGHTEIVTAVNAGLFDQRLRAAQSTD